MTLRIAGGRVYDPTNGVAGDVRDVCLDDGKVVDDVPAHAPRIDARGMVVMPGGVDIHAHIAGPKVNAARRLAPEEHRGDVVDRSAIMRSGTGGTVPSTFVTTRPETGTAALNVFAWTTAFWPIVPSRTRSVSCGASGRRFLITRATFFSSSIRLSLV